MLLKFIYYLLNRHLFRLLRVMNLKQKQELELDICVLLLMHINFIWKKELKYFGSKQIFLQRINVGFS